MAVIPRVYPIGGVALCLILAAVAIPAFARGARSHPAVAPERSTASTGRSAPIAPIAPPAPDSVAVAATAAMSEVPASERGDTSTGLSGLVRVHLLAPGSAPPGVYTVPGGVGGEPFAFIGLTPFTQKRGASVDGYNVGFWPAELHSVRSDAYDNPAGFVEVTAENAGTSVSEHFTLGDLVTHDGAPLPKYIVLREALLDKIELVLSDLKMHGVDVQHVKVLSGFRTPAYNFGLGDASGRARESRHQFGDAMDLIIDADGDGRMDDLNHDGRVDMADVRVIEAAVDRVERAHPELAGGLGLYQEMGPSGPFAHVDVRGTRARWGGGGPTSWMKSSYASGNGGAGSASGSHCQAEGASAVLCQGFRHTR